MNKKMLISLIFFLAMSINIVSGSITGITLSSPGNATFTTDQTPDFVFTPTSDYDSTFTCELFIGGSPYGINSSVENATQTTLTANTTISDGSYDWFINCTDTNGTVQSSTLTLTIDSTDPSVSVVSPTATTYRITVGETTVSVPLNYVASDTNIDSCWYNTGSTNITIASCVNTTLTLTENSYTLQLYANDSAGNIGSDSVTFIVSDAVANSLPSPFNILLAVALGAVIVLLIIGLLFAENITPEIMIGAIITIVIILIVIANTLL